MTASVPAPKSRTLSARRLVLLAGVAGLGVTVLLGSAGILPQPGAPLSAIAYAQGAERPMGFADIVEKVKPAVVSVRVKLASGPKMMGFEGDTPFPPNVERFFRRFGLPEGATPEERRAPREHLVTGQGSGFFISTDGYAVTNNHVVDGADKVEVTADDGKVYKAKVIGTDARTDVAEMHGTAVAGIIAARADNGQGVAGVAPARSRFPVVPREGCGEVACVDFGSGVGVPAERTAIAAIAKVHVIRIAFIIRRTRASFGQPFGPWRGQASSSILRGGRCHARSPWPSRASSGQAGSQRSAKRAVVSILRRDRGLLPS